MGTSKSKKINKFLRELVRPSKVNEEPTTDSCNNSITRKIDQKEFDSILLEHNKWIESEGREGEKLDFSNLSLPPSVRITGRLENVSFYGACLRGIVFDNAILTRSDFRNADLQDTEFKKVQGLTAGQIAGADVTNSNLPEDIKKFEGLKAIEDASRNARKLFLIMLLGCVYSLITIATTTDVRLITNSTSSPLPVIGTEIPIVSFYWAGPLFLISVYLYFHVYLQRLWEGLTRLPAIFPDGISLDNKAYPWLLLGLVRNSFLKLKDRHLPLFGIQTFLATLLAWWSVPATLFLFWLRFIRRHDWLGTSFQICILSLIIPSSFVLYKIFKRTSQLEKDPSLKTFRFFWYTSGILVFLLFLLLSWSGISGVNPREIGSHFNPLRVISTLFYTLYNPYANLEDQEISIKPDVWTELPEQEKSEIASVIRADLRGKNLRYARALGAFFLKADLTGANLQGADLTNADLRYTRLNNTNLSSAILLGVLFNGAELVGARLNLAILENADMSGLILHRAIFNDAFLTDAILDSAELQLSQFHRANLSGASFVGASLRWATLDSAKLGEANFRGADLFNAFLFYAELAGACFDSARLEKANFVGADLLNTSFVGAVLTLARLDSTELEYADLSYAVLDGASFIGANLAIARLDSTDASDTNFQGADLWYASFTGANLAGANLDRADLRLADLRAIKNYRKIRSIKYANVWGINNSPEGFVSWADSMGAVFMESDEEWEALIKGDGSGEQ